LPVILSGAKNLWSGQISSLNVPTEAVILSGAKNLSWLTGNDLAQRFFAEFILERSEGLRMTGTLVLF
jgi:hypothetical protein